MSTGRPRDVVPLALVLIAGSFTAAAIIDSGFGDDPAPQEVVDGGSGHASWSTEVAGAGGTPVNVTIFKPAGASAGNPVPFLLHGHGWGGAGWDPGAEDEGGEAHPYLEAGYGVASIDQRGHGDSGGQARVMAPDHEAEDVQAVVDHVSDNLAWVENDTGEPDDPTLGALGGSYGGGYQLVAALDEVDEDGTTRFDALAPEITWYDLPRSLAPNGVVKSEWVDLLVSVAKGPPVTDTHPRLVDGPYAYTVATGDVPGDEAPGARNVSRAYLAHSPAGFVDNGTKLDVPVLFQQGMSDTLFPLDQAVANYRNTLTDAARSESYVVAHTTGHTLPSLGPPPGRLQAPAGGATPCADDVPGSKTGLLLEWYNATLRNESATLPSAAVTVAKEDGTCLGFPSLPGADTFATPDTDPVTLSGPAGPPNLVPVVSGPETIAGAPTVDLNVTSTSLDTRFFVALAVGPSRAEAQVIHSQWRPVRLQGPVDGQEITVDLPDVAADVESDEEVYLATASSLDMYAHHGSRTPGPVVLGDVGVHLPTVD